MMCIPCFPESRLSAGLTCTPISALMEPLSHGRLLLLDADYANWLAGDLPASANGASFPTGAHGQLAVGQSPARAPRLCVN